MFGTALIVFREVLEAALIVGIVGAATRGIAGRSRFILAGLALGIVSWQLVAAFIFCSWVLGSLVTLVACGLEEHGYRNYRQARDLGRMMALAVFENMWFRQLIDLYRLIGVYDIARRKQGWGAMRRTGFNEA